MSELCRSIAYEAVRRGAQANVHELWAALEAVEDVHPRLVVDVGSDPAIHWAWWATGAHVIGVTAEPAAISPAFSGDRLPEGVVGIAGDPLDASTLLRVSDQLAGRALDVLVIGRDITTDGARAAYRALAPSVRERGLVLVHGIADRPPTGASALWRELKPAGGRELIGSNDPIGYGVAVRRGKDRSNA
jgi:hypothetical protein